MRISRVFSAPAWTWAPPLLAWVTLAVSLAATALVWQQTRADAARIANIKLSHQAAEVSAAVIQRMQTYELALRGGAALFATSETVSREDWKTYTAALEIKKYFPGIQGVGVSRVVMPAAKEAHQQQVRATGFPDYVITPAGERPLYTAIVYIEPMDARNRRALGYDMFFEPVRRAAMAQARDTGQAAISGRVTLRQDLAGDLPGFLMYLPLYRAGLPTDTVAQRRAALHGYVFSPFRMADLMRGILGGDAPNKDVNLAIFDGVNIAESSRVYATPGSGGHEPSRFKVQPLVSTLLMNGYPWTLKVAASQSFDENMERQKPLIVGLGGLAISLLLFAVMSLLSLRARALGQELAARKRAQETLQEREEKLAAILDTALDATVQMDINGIITGWSAQAETIFGWSQAQAMGRALHDIMVPERYREAYLQGMKHFLVSGQGPLLNRRVETQALHRDGHEFPVELSIAPLMAQGQRAFSAFIRDISERQQARAEILQLNASLEGRVQQRTAQLQVANQQLEAFSYSVAHDLRSPLNTISGFGGLLENSLNQPASEPSSERNRHYLARIRAGAAQMGELIEALLTLAQVERSSLRWEPVDLGALAQTLSQGYQERAPGRQVQWKLQAGLLAQGDPGLLRQVLDNLLGNAWKFSAGQACAEIEVGRQTGSAGETVYFVRDNGAGFDMAHADKLFGAFQRLHTQAEFAGTGIGLATVQRIVARHGGKIWGESAPGQGATFYFTLGTQAP